MCTCIAEERSSVALAASGVQGVCFRRQDASRSGRQLVHSRTQKFTQHHLKKSMNCSVTWPVEIGDTSTWESGKRGKAKKVFSRWPSTVQLTRTYDFHPKCSSLPAPRISRDFKYNLFSYLLYPNSYTNFIIK